MKEISHHLRKAYLDLLNPLVVEGVTIPVFDMVLNPNDKPKAFKGGNAFVLISNQTEVETTNNDCTFRQDALITFDVIVQYPNGSGSRLATELISNEIQKKVVSLNGENIDLDGSSFQLLNTKKNFSQSLYDQGQTLTAYRKRITFTQQVWETP